MRFRFVLPLACLLALAVPVAKASAAPIVGISENQPSMFGDPLFKSIGIKHARIVVGWDVVARGGYDLTRVAQYIGEADAAGGEALRAIPHTGGQRAAGH